MTGDELDAARVAIGWTMRELARRLGCSDAAIRKWIAGTPLPPAIGPWIAQVRQAIERLPPPRWRG